MALMASLMSMPLRPNGCCCSFDSYIEPHSWNL